MAEYKDILDSPYEERQYLYIVKNAEERERIVKQDNDIQSGKGILALISASLLGGASLLFTRNKGFSGMKRFGLASLATATTGIGLDMILSSLKLNERLKLITFEEARNIKFKDVKPIENMIYVINPMDPTFYHKAPTFHEEMEDHKFSEAINLLQALGATEITAIKVENYGTRGAVDFTAGNGEVHSDHQSRTYYHTRHNPRHKPSIPEGLVWYHNELQWKNIAEGRLRYGMESIEMEVELSNDFGINGKLIKDLGNALKLNVSTDYKEFKKTLIKISAVFNPM
ncbi:hypothetical protein [Ammoniphilus resinae]|uniref:Uncharacterized protein n=1 Tax=Ammoniphilus resinae TaxID=861532 RepID=A0ABS4GNI7_9BACL|nr:hypothetical protein [Ammoniphilus resinae]MBP1931828.1 hypothetical protein [Ammoniphilus resinae]